MTTPTGRISAGYGDSMRHGRDERLGQTFEYSEHYETMAAMEKDEPERFGKVSQTVRLGFGHYIEAKQAAQRAGLDVGAPTTRENS